MSESKNTFSAVTTFNLNKQPFGIEMIESFFINWPSSIKLTAFIEDSASIDSSKVRNKIEVREFSEHIPEYKIFCEKYKYKKPFTDDFRFNVFRFAHKVYAIAKALQYNSKKYLIWLDSDIKTHKKIPISFFDQLISENYYLSYLGREHIKIKELNYSECGFLIFNTEHKYHNLFWKEMMTMYDKGMLFNLPEWHDSYIFDFVRKKLESKYNLNNINISELGLVKIESNFDEHVFVSSILGKYMDHKKGDRKDLKWSPELIKRIKKEKKL